MTDTRPTGVVEDDRFLEHRAPPGHPECEMRVRAVGQAIRARADKLTPIAARPAGDDEILWVHAPGHLKAIQEAARHAPTRIDADTYMSEASLEVARLAAGGAVELVRSVVSGEIRSGIAAVRPPGHHAEASRAMGFCLFNNAAIAARALQRMDGVERILLIDWDVHHGNGTQHMFENDPSVLYFSTHQFPYYPGTGAFEEIGVDRGLGTTVNVPMPPGCGDREYVGVLQRVLVPVAQRYAPDFILVSCGFDAHRDDPLASMEISEGGFQAMSRIVRRLADELCGGRIAFVLEGGYAASGLLEGTGAVLDALIDPTPPPPPTSGPVERGSTLYGLLERVEAIHGSNFPGLRAR